MLDRLLDHAFWAVITGLLMLTAGLSLALGYGGLLHLLAGRAPSAGFWLTGSLLLALASHTLLHHRDDLLDR